jgi:phosphoglycolate phosphatase
VVVAIQELRIIWKQTEWVLLSGNHIHSSSVTRETMITNVLFDLDGTLTDPKDGITRCIQFSLGRLGRDAPSSDELLWCIGPPLKQSFSRLLEDNDNDLVDLALQYYRERFSEIGMYENSIYPGITMALHEIYTAGFRVFLATSKPTVFAARIIEHFRLTQFFHGIYGSELNGRLSDKADLIAHVLKIEGLDPQLTLMVGDRFHDIVGGKKNGTVTAAVMYGYGSQNEIEEAKPDFVFHYPSDLAAYLNSTTERVVAPDR